MGFVWEERLFLVIGSLTVGFFAGIGAWPSVGTLLGIGAVSCIWFLPGELDLHLVLDPGPWPWPWSLALGLACAAMQASPCGHAGLYYVAM